MQKKYAHLLQIDEKYIIFAADLIPREDAIQHDISNENRQP